MYVSCDNECYCALVYNCRGVDFRQEFSNIGEIRSLLPRWTNFMALTATANVTTQHNIIKSLEMKEVLRICKMPNIPNLFLSVVKKPDCEISQIVTPIVNEIAQSGISVDKHFVFCRTYKETMELFQEAVLQLHSRNALYVSPPSGTEVHLQSYHRTCEKYDAFTAERMKDHINNISCWTIFEHVYGIFHTDNQQFFSQIIQLYQRFTHHGLHQVQK